MGSLFSPKVPEPPPPPELPDYDKIKAAARKKQAVERSKGRSSTVLTGDKLG